MSLLDTSRAKALLDEATLSAEDVASCRGRLTAFLERYLPLFYRKEQRLNAGVVVRGLLGDTGRKTCEPVAHREQRVRRVFSDLLRDRPPTAEEIAHAVSRVGRRTVGSRIYHWWSATARYPPSRFP